MTEAEQIERLLELEANDRFEPYTRLIGVATAGVLLYFYTSSAFVLLWPIWFSAAFLLHLYYLKTLSQDVNQRQMKISAALFLHLQTAYGWLPATLFCSMDRSMVLVGACLLGAQLSFLLRRNDTILYYNAAQVLVISALSVIVYIVYFPYFETPLAIFGCALALIALNFYFVQSMRVARKMRLSVEKATRDTLQAQKMAAVGQLAGGVAHDFNNNLTAIMGSLELLQLSDNPAEQKADLENALLAARQAATTVKHLLIYARMEKPDITITCLREVMEELVMLTGRLIPASVKLQLEPVPENTAVQADRHQLLAGLINLVVNSVDALPQGGTINIRCAHIAMTRPEPLADGTLLPAGNYIEIAIADDGTGIPPEILHSVLDPFFTTKPVGKGTGLGLSMVLGMSHELGGGLAIVTGKAGTTIRLFLPAATD